MKRLSYICKVQRVPISELPFTILLHNRTFELPDSIPWKEVKCQKPAKLEISDKLEDGERIYTHKLTIKTCDEDMVSKIPYAYLVTDLESRKYLIGTGERPYPVITESEVHPDSYSSSTLIEVTISWVAKRKAPKIA